MTTTVKDKAAGDTHGVNASREPDGLLPFCLYSLWWVICRVSLYLVREQRGGCIVLVITGVAEKAPEHSCQTGEEEASEGTLVHGVKATLFLPADNLYLGVNCNCSCSWYSWLALKAKWKQLLWSKLKFLGCCLISTVCFQQRGCFDLQAASNTLRNSLRLPLFSFRIFALLLATKFPPVDTFCNWSPACTSVFVFLITNFQKTEGKMSSSSDEITISLATLAFLELSLSTLHSSTSEIQWIWNWKGYKADLQRAWLFLQHTSLFSYGKTIICIWTETKRINCPVCWILGTSLHRQHHVLSLVGLFFTNLISFVLKKSLKLQSILKSLLSPHSCLSSFKLPFIANILLGFFVWILAQNEKLWRECCNFCCWPCSHLSQSEFCLCVP